MYKAIISWIITLLTVVNLSAQEQVVLNNNINGSVVLLKSDKSNSYAFIIAPGIVACPIADLDIKGNLMAVDKYHLKIEGFTYVDINNNFVLMKIEQLQGKPLSLANYKPEPEISVLQVNVGENDDLILNNGKLSERKDYGDVQLLITESKKPVLAGGLPLLDSAETVIGMSVPAVIHSLVMSFYIPSDILRMALEKQHQPKPLSQLEPYTEQMKKIVVKSNEKSKSVKEFLDAGIEKLSLKDYKAAIEKFNLAIRVSPIDADAYAFRGQAKYHLMMYKDAIADYNRALELQPDYAEVYDLRGICKAELGDMAGACDDWKTSYEYGYNPAFKLLVKFCDLK